MPKKLKSVEECTETIKIPLIVLEENRKKMTFHNKQRKDIRKIKVDGCAMTEGKRCDYLVINDKDCEHFVELKGTDVEHACEQLSISITKLSKNLKQEKHSFVIASRVIPAISTTIQRFKSQFRSKFNCKLIVKNQQHECEI